MQLLLETETIISNEKEMSKVEEILSEKIVTNNDVGELETVCNGNKENIEYKTVISNDGEIDGDSVNSVANIQTSEDNLDLEDKIKNIVGHIIDNEQTQSQENDLAEVVENILSKSIDCGSQEIVQQESNGCCLKEQLTVDFRDTGNDVSQTINDTQGSGQELCASLENVNQQCISNDGEILSVSNNAIEDDPNGMALCTIENCPKETCEGKTLEHNEEIKSPVSENIDSESKDNVVSKTDLQPKSREFVCETSTEDSKAIVDKNKINKSNDSTIQTDLENSLDVVDEKHKIEINDVIDSTNITQLEDSTVVVDDNNKVEINEVRQESKTEEKVILSQVEHKNGVEKADISEKNESRENILSDTHAYNTTNSELNKEIIDDEAGEKVEIESSICINLNKEQEETTLTKRSDNMEVEEIDVKSEENESDVGNSVDKNKGLADFTLTKATNDMEVEEVSDNNISPQIPNNSAFADFDKIEEEPVLNDLEKQKVDYIQDVNDKTAELNKDSKKSMSNVVPNIIDTVQTKDVVPGTTDTSASKDKTKEEVKDIVGVNENDSKTTTTQNDNHNSASSDLKDEMNVEEVKITVDDNKTEKAKAISVTKGTSVDIKTVPFKPTCKLSNMLDILSDDEDESCQVEPTRLEQKENETTDKQCINIEDDDDIMVIDDEVSTKSAKPLESNIPSSPKAMTSTDLETIDTAKQNDALFSTGTLQKESESAVQTVEPNIEIDIKEKPVESEAKKQERPLLPENFLKSAKKSIADMTREDLEEFCILKIVESVVDRSSLSEIKTKLKTMAQSIDEYRKKATMLTKQNRDLQVVLKSVQEEQKKMTDSPIVPLKITRSVGMQVLMIDKPMARKKGQPLQQQSSNIFNTNQVPKQNVKSSPSPGPRPQKPPPNNLIPVPRLVPANIPAPKSVATPIVNASNPVKVNNSTPNGIKNPPAQKAAEKRQHNKMHSVTVDLTDDEPPAKMNTRNSPAPPVRLVSPQNLMQQKPTFATGVNSPRKVYIPIGGPQNQTIRAGQTIMLKTVPPGVRPRASTPQMARMTPPVRMNRVTSGNGARHPAPLPDAMKQYQPPNWKALPPAPDLRLSKVENGIVISWKIDGYQEDSYEEIASYQLYAYQETSSPPSTALWKKIGDVKALPLPMACTLTQFMAGFKYYFAVRAVDVKSRLGPFSLPGSILLLNKL